jgi:hypothetical protein
MTRAESVTRSITQVRVSASEGEAWLRWWPRPLGGEAPDPHHPAATMSLALATPSPR